MTSINQTSINQSVNRSINKSECLTQVTISENCRAELRCASHYSFPSRLYNFFLKNLYLIRHRLRVGVVVGLHVLAGGSFPAPAAVVVGAVRWGWGLRPKRKRRMRVSLKRNNKTLSCTSFPSPSHSTFFLSIK